MGDLGMSGFKGTPGPWKYAKNGPHWNNAALERISIEFGIYGENIADTVYEENDARLIAAAPDLLEACERARSHLYQAGYEPKENSLNPNEDLLFQLDATISNAIGE